MTELMRYVDTIAGKIQFAAAKRNLASAGLPEDSEDGISLATFTEGAQQIMLPTEIGKSGQVAAEEFVKARESFQDLVSILRGSIITETFGEDESPTRAERVSLRLEGGGPGPLSTQLSFSSNPSAGAAAGGSTSSPPTEAAAAGGSAAGTKRSRLGMSDADLARACTAVDTPAAKVTPQFLVDKPLDVRMYTPLLIDLYASVRKVNEGISRLASEIYQFEGDFLELPEASALSLVPSRLTAALDTTGGSRLFHRMDELRAAAVVLKAKNLRCQRGFWVGNHTAGCNWDTWEQLVHRENEDAGADLCNPGYTPLATWEDQVKAAIVAARQESVALSKDGKTLLGPVLPRLLARHHSNKGGIDRRNGGGARGGADGFKSGGYGKDKAPGAQRFNRHTPKPPRKPAGKENRSTNAGAGAPAKSTPKPAET